MTNLGIYYLAVFLCSLALTAVYTLLWQKHDDVHITLVFTLIPIVNLGYLLLYHATSREAALISTQLCYVGGCFLQLMIMLVIFSLCKVKVPRLLRLGFLLLSMGVYLSTLTIGQKDWFYASAVFDETTRTLIKQYGPLHAVFYGVVIVYFAVSIGTIIYSLIRKNQVSRKILLLLFLPEILCMVAFFGGRRLVPEVELMPAAYLVAQITYLLIAWRLKMYNVTDTVIDAMVESGDTGFITFDSRFHYLGSNDTAQRILPDLNQLTVDLGMKKDSALRELLYPWLVQFRDEPENEAGHAHLYEQGDRYYEFTVGPLRARRRHKGYRIVITDDTKDRTIIRLQEEENERLDQKVQAQTAHIVQMHDNLVLSMAVMVESRDNSTGGHIRRTSEVIRLLMETVEREGMTLAGYDLTEDFCRMLIKAAPMHDLGKIAVDDAILRKPGRFEPAEYEIMKKHAPEGGRIVHEILKDTDDEAFHHLAENVARYHHERWDGKGYPEGLKGEEIPPEARLMAIADVYDALVSKRVYKDSMSFEQADAIMMEGMGSQFDPALEPLYAAARPRLEEYYSSLQVQDSVPGE